MRYKILIHNPLQKLPLEYRRVFLSLIKHALSIRNIDGFVFSQKRTRPFVFSVYLGRGMKFSKEANTIQTDPLLSLWFSTGDHVLGSELLAGMMELRNRDFSYQEHRLRVHRVDVLREVPIQTNVITFRTRGIAVLTDPREDAEQMDRWFILPDDPRFPEVFDLRARERFRWIHGFPYTGSLRIDPIEWKTHRVHHYGLLLKGFTGKMKVEADPVMLRFLYHYGIGVRTAQGFGMVEIGG